MATRRYTSRKRALTAAQTRANILDAAQRLFTDNGYSRTTMQQIADAAAVSVQSVYLAGSKAALMMAVLERGFTGDEQFISLLERPDFMAIMADPDTDRALSRYVDYVVSGNSRVADLWHVARLAADSEPAIREQLDRAELRRIDDIGVGSYWFVQRELLTESRVPEFADILGYLTAPETYRYFTVGRGWTTERFAGWLRQSILQYLEG